MDALGDQSKAFKEVSDALKEEQKKAGLDSADKFVDELEDIKELAKKGPGDILDKVKEAFKSFMDQIDSALADPSALLGGGGALAACASYYGNAVVAKLKSLKGDAEKLFETLGKLASSVMAPFKELGEVLTKAMESITKSMKKMMTLPKELEEMADTIKSPSDVGKLDLSDIKKALDMGTLSGPLGDLGGLKGSMGPMVKEVKEGLESLAKFIMDAPDKVKSAFNAPAPLCMMNSMIMSQAPAPMTAMLEKLEMLKGFDLKPLLDMLGKTKSSVADMDVSSVKVPMESFSKSASEKLEPLETAIDTAKKAGGISGAVGSIMGAFGK